MFGMVEMGRKIGIRVRCDRLEFSVFLLVFVGYLTMSSLVRACLWRDQCEPVFWRYANIALEIESPCEYYQGVVRTVVGTTTLQ